jgi:hypothetical protein
MALNSADFNISKFNELEEGEISDTNINKQDILKLIVFITIILIPSNLGKTKTSYFPL